MLLFEVIELLAGLPLNLHLHHQQLQYFFMLLQGMINLLEKPNALHIIKHNIDIFPVLVRLQILWHKRFIMNDDY